MKAKKVLALVLCAALLVAGSVAATLAYLTSKTEVVTNTFSVGNVTITLDETDVDVYGKKDGDSRVTENTYKLIPGHNYLKDPTIHVKKGSEECWLFVKVVDEIAAIQDATTVADQMAENGWEKLTGEENVWFYNTKVDARTAENDVDVDIFGEFTIKNDAQLFDAEDNAIYAGKTITVQAYAVQADGFTDALDAWSDAALKDWQ